MESELSLSAAEVSSFETMRLIAMGIYLARRDSISIDDYTGVRGGGAASTARSQSEMHLYRIGWEAGLHVCKRAGRRRDRLTRPAAA